MSQLVQIEESFLKFLEAHRLVGGTIKDADGNQVKAKIDKNGYWVSTVSEVKTH